MTDEQLNALGKALFARLNLGDPENADVQTILKALFIKELMQILLGASKLISIEDRIEILRAFADTMELVCLETSSDF